MPRGPRANLEGEPSALALANHTISLQRFVLD
jgi:hypothetical protein